MKKPIFFNENLHSNVRTFARDFKRKTIMKFIVLFLITFPFLPASSQNVIDLSNTTDSILVVNGQAINIPHVKSLVYEVQPTVYIQDGVIKLYTTDPVIRVDMDTKSITSLSEQNESFKDVELIIIRITTNDDLNFTLDITKLPSFSSLKYVFFLCSYECDPSSIGQIFQHNGNDGINVFYQVSIPE